MKRLLCFIMLTMLSPLMLAATLHSMTKAQIQRVVINKTLVSIPTDNLNGKMINNTFSMYMDDRGNIYGKMSLKPDGEPQTDKGIYTIGNDGTIIITWNHWDNKEKMYAQFFETKNAYLAIDRDNIFHTVYLKEAILSGNKINLSSD